jgi:hypothetical protein
MNKLPILISETEVLTVIEGLLTEKEISEVYLQPSFQTLMKSATGSIYRCIKEHNMKKPHFYRIKIQVHAQLKEEESE